MRAQDSVLVFNELQYHPANEASQTEWIELRSLQAVNVDIGGWRLEGGIEYTFPNGTVVNGGAHIVVAKIPAQIAGAYGPFTGQLDNGGEAIRLRNRNGRIMDEIDYSDGGDWPRGPDGCGVTLARRSATAAPGPAHWTASAQAGGTPGALNFPTGIPAPTLLLNEISAANDAGFFFELRNVSATAVDTAGWVLKTSAGSSFTLPAGSVAAGGFIHFTATSLGLTPTNGMRLALFAPGGSAYRDARSISARLQGLTPAGDWEFPNAPTPSAANTFSLNTAIVINEIYYHAPGTSLEQWVELHNRSEAAVNVSGWRFSDGITYTIPAGTPPIPAGGFLVVAWDPSAFAALHPGVTALGPFMGTLSRNGELLRLRDANDNIADEVDYKDGGSWSAWADGGGSSLELRDADADNSRGEAWDASDESSRSAWTTISAGTYQGLGTNSNGPDPNVYNEFVFGLLDAGEFLIDDISVRLVSGGNAELIQNGGFESGNANAWRIIGTHSGTVINDPTGPGKVLKVSASGPTEHMHNHAATTLKNGASYVTVTAADTYAITFRAKWLRGSNRLHTRLWHNRLPRQTLLDMPTTGGTPGAVNSTVIANIGPTFSNLAASPVVPPSGQPCAVTVRVGDPDGVASVQLFTAINGGAFSSVAMAGSNGIFTATVPAQAGGALVQFYVRATDSAGAVSFYPPAGPASRAMIPWQDGRQTISSALPPRIIRVVLPTADATEMYKAENLMSDALLPGTVILDENTAFYRAGIRLKSSEHGRIVENRCGYTLEFPPDDLFLGRHDTIAVDRSGGTVTGQRELLLRRLTNTAGGIVASEDDLCRIISAVGTAQPGQFTGANITGTAILSKTRLDKEFLDAQWPNGGDGAQHKYERVYVLTETIDPTTRARTTMATASGGTHSPTAAVLTAAAEQPKAPQSSTSPPGVSVVGLGTQKESYRWYWLLQNSRSADDYTGIINVTTAVGQTGGSVAFNTQVDQFIDVSAWLRACVPSALYGVTDNYLGTGGGLHNALIQSIPGKKAVLIPWDLDFLNQGNSSASLTSGGDLSKFIQNPVWRRLYYGHLHDILSRSFTTPYMTTWANHYMQFGTDDMATQITNYLTPRREFAWNTVTGSNGFTAPVPFVNFTRTSASPISVNTPFTTVTGDGWINIAEIRLVGSSEPLPVTWTDDNSWSLPLPVYAGMNTYTLTAYDYSGATIGSISVTATGTGGVFPAGPGNLIISELHYNPPGSADDTEFIELCNITTATLDLSGCHFDEESGQGIQYTFANGTTLAPGARIVIARNRTAFLAAYPSASPQLAAGQYDPSALDNGGESIVLYAANGLEIFRVSYTDSIPSTDGNGRSMVHIFRSTLPALATYEWRASIANGGTPGSTDAVTFSGSADADADGDGTRALLEYTTGTSDTAPQPMPGTLTPAAGGWLFTFPRALNADDASLQIQGTTSLLTPWGSVTATLQSSQITGANAIESWFVIPPANSREFYLRLKATLR